MKKILSLLSAKDSLLDFNLYDRKASFTEDARPLEFKLNLGCSENILDGFLNIDIAWSDKLSLLCDAQKLSFKDESLDCAILDHVLEYVSNPWLAAQEVMRVLKPGAKLYVSAAFIYPYHPKPEDNFRFTPSGLKALFPGARVIEQGVSKGPFSVCLSLLCYALACFFSFNNNFVFRVLRSLFIYLFSVFKYLDIIVFKLKKIPLWVFSGSYIIAVKDKR